MTNSDHTIVTPDLELRHGDVLIVTVPCGSLPHHKAKQRIEEIKSKFDRVFPNNYVTYLGTTSAGSIQFTRVTQDLTDEQKADILSMLHEQHSGEE